MNPLAWSALLAGLSSIIFGIIVLYKSPNRRLGQIWFVFNLFVAGWSFGALWLWTSQSYIEAYLAIRVAYATGIIWIASTFHHFVVVFLDRKSLVSVYINYLISCAFMVTLPTPYFFRGARWVFGMYYGDAGPLLGVFCVWWIGLVIYSHYRLLKEFPNLSYQKRLQVKYFFLAVCVGFTGGSTAYIPNFRIDVYPWGHFCVFIYPFIMAYAIIKHKLMDIEFVVRKTLIYSLATGALAVIMAIIAIASAHITEGILGRQTFSLLITAIVVAALFHPIQLRIQEIVDRYLFRDWVDRPVGREIAAGFSHELKSPLAGLSLRAEMTLAELDEVEKGGKSLQEVLPKIKQELGYILSQALDAARRIEAVRGVSEPVDGQIEPVQVAAALDGALFALKARLEESRATVERRLSEPLPLVRSNAKQLEIVFINLIKNALDSMEDAHVSGSASPILTIEADQINGLVSIAVKDVGPGIPQKDLARIFDPYFTTKGHKGTGMGLYLTHQIVKAHGGTIEVNSQEGRGSEFVVKLLPYSARGATAA